MVRFGIFILTFLVAHRLISLHFIRINVAITARRAIATTVSTVSPEAGLGAMFTPCIRIYSIFIPPMVMLTESGAIIPMAKWAAHPGLPSMVAGWETILSLATAGLFLNQSMIIKATLPGHIFIWQQGIWAKIIVGPEARW